MRRDRRLVACSFGLLLYLTLYYCACSSELRSLRLNTPRLCRFAVFWVKTNVSLSEEDSFKSAQARSPCTLSRAPGIRRKARKHVFVSLFSTKSHFVSNIQAVNTRAFCIIRCFLSRIRCFLPRVWSRGASKLPSFTSATMSPRPRRSWGDKIARVPHNTRC